MKKKPHMYWDSTFNTTWGCTPYNEGCENCWAREMSDRFKIDFDPHKLPIKKAPQKGVVFVCNTSDLFMFDDDHICATLDALSPHAVNLVLTKRVQEMCLFLKKHPRYKAFAHVLWGASICGHGFEPLFMSLDANKWISYEPLLAMPQSWILLGSRIKFIVVGCESGKKRRPCKLEWVEEIMRSCSSSRIPCFIKQLDINGKVCHDISKFPQHLQVRETPWSNK